MFSYTGLTSEQVQALKEKYHVYLLKSGRASISGCKSIYPVVLDTNTNFSFSEHE